VNGEPIYLGHDGFYTETELLVGFVPELKYDEVDTDVDDTE
jgi:hypothetical protein